MVELYREDQSNEIVTDLAGRNDNWEALETAINALNDALDDLDTELQTHKDKNTSEAHDPLLQNYRETCVVANSGATYTFDLSAGNVFEITLTDNCTFTMPPLPAAPSGGVGEALSFTVRLKQDGTGNRVPTFNTTIWPEGEAPELSTGAGEIDKLVFTGWPGETNWEGDLAGVNYSAVS